VITANRTLTVPDKSGTIAIAEETCDLLTNQTVGGNKTFSGITTISNTTTATETTGALISNGGVLLKKHIRFSRDVSTIRRVVLWSGDGTYDNDYQSYHVGIGPACTVFNVSGGAAHFAFKYGVSSTESMSLMELYPEYGLYLYKPYTGLYTRIYSGITASRDLQLPDKSGTIAITDDIPTNYVTTDTVQTITGAKDFSGGIDMGNVVNSFRHEIVMSCNFSGPWSVAINQNINIARYGNQVIIKVPETIGVCDVASNTISLDALDLEFRPGIDQYIPIVIVDNGYNTSGYFKIQTTGYAVIRMYTETNFYNGGNCGFRGFSVSYLL